MHGQKHTHRTHALGHSGTDTSECPRIRGHVWRCSACCWSAQLMVILDITAVNIALPSLAADLQLSGSTVSWTITSYSLIFGSLLLFGGRLADLVGRRRMFLTGLGVFTVSSVASALAGTAAALFAARAGQGLGAAMLSPAALSIITTAFQGHAAGEGARSLGCRRRRRRCDRRPRRRRSHRGRRLAADLLRQHPGRDRTRSRRAAGHPERRREAALAWPRRFPAHSSARSASARSSMRSPRRIRPAGARPRRSGSQHSHWSASLPSRPGSAGPRSRFCVSSGSPIARVGGGLFLMIVAAELDLRLFLLCSLYLQNVLGTAR